MMQICVPEKGNEKKSRLPPQVPQVARIAARLRPSAVMEERIV